MALMAHDTTDRLGSGLAFALASAVSFGLSGPLARGLMDAGWTPAAAVAIRVLLGGVVLVPAALVALRGRWWLVRRAAPTIVAYGVVAVAGCQLAYFTAVSHLQVGVALLIEYAAPLAVVAWLWLRHGQRPTGLTVVGAALGVAGLVLVLDLLGGAAVSAVGVAWALLAMLCAAVYFVLSASADHELPGVVLAAGALLVGGTVLVVAGATGLLPFAVADAAVLLAGSALPWWVPVLALGLVTAGAAYVTGIEAARRLGARLASFCALTEVLAALALAWLLLGERPGPVQVLGGILVLAGVVAVKLGEPRTVATTGGTDGTPG